MSGQLAMVTGAGRGIGLEVARGLAARGFEVLAGVRNPARMAAIPGVTALELDVSDEASVRRAAARAAEGGRRIGVLVNNAAVLLKGDDAILNLETGQLRQTLETNTLGPLRVAQAFAPLMGRGGRILNVSSGGGQLSSPSTWAPAYCISKTALNAVTVQLAEALRPEGIAVNAVCPGWVRTDMGGAEAPRSVEEGAAGILWLAVEAPAELTGGFFRDGVRIPW
ncbi:MAG: SDR family NAD(P)-dependent oxidoreductase [Acidobacteria bacterium]|nr:SDR family NAD(P)-dependent oxidoreductase [Acidobacteriota bacterium]